MASHPPGPSGTHKRRKSQTDSQNTNQFNEARVKYDHGIEYGFKRLEKLSKKDLITLVVEITEQQSGFHQLFDSDLSDDCLVLIMKILALVGSTGTDKNKAIITTTASKYSFHKSLQRFVLNLTVQDKAERTSSCFWKDPQSFFTNSAIVFGVVIESVSSRAYDVLVKTIKLFKVTIMSLSGEGLDKDALGMFEKLENFLDLIKLETVYRVEEVKVKYEHKNDTDFDQPHDFRHLDVYPNVDDVLQHRGYLRKNLIDKRCETVDYYLDVQFWLLKEDFLGPLRDRIAEYLRYTGPPKEFIKTSNVRIYTKVRFISSTLIHGRLGVLLEFQAINEKRPTKINLSKRFMFGSLLCFSNDNFQSMFFGKVIKGSIDLLQMGQVIVGLEPGQENYALDRPYVMIECSVYFEPYYHVLKSLQNMDEIQFPMQKYIIDLNSTIDPVSYIHPGLQYITENTDTLDTAQREAFQAALEKEFVVIQGGPGTGKTFLGLKIAKTLIENKAHWYKSSPILVVCNTNHALDRFLEGLQDTTTDMIRVGGQSKNKHMKKFSLKEKQSFLGSQMDTRTLNTAEEKHTKCLSDIKHYNDLLKDVESNTVIINIKKFSVIDKSISSSWFWTATDQEIIEWLFGGRTIQERLLEKKKIEVKQLKETCEQDYFHDEHEIDDVKVKNTNYHLTTVEEIRSLIKKIKCKETEEVYDKNFELHAKLFRLEGQLNYLQMRFEEYENEQVENKPQNCNLQNPHSMCADHRWQLYLYWVEMYKQHLRYLLLQLQDKYLTVQKQYSEIKDVFDLAIMKKMLVVGMTTTDTARSQTMIKNLKSPIVIVEEAAEILESHLIVSLTSHCRHLILIGDHQQMRSSTSNYYLGRYYNLGISLFERMVRNNFQCHVLGVQYRMRPEIASLIVPAIYPKLENHPSVNDFPPVSGIVPNLYFIDHKFEEEESNDSSKLNQHEAKFLIALARYLIQNGYKPEDITILAAYSAQMFVLWKEQRSCLNLLEGVRIAVLDNYQREESKIILLSLVRNNKERNIGFLKNENRVCVALSRAKEGFYMMGNMDLLCQNSSVWPKIKTVLESQGNLGRSLLLQCQIHSDQETEVALPEDFIKVAEGCCSKVCNAELKCGHYCTMICHVLDREHANFKCKAKCFKIICENGHSCPDYCFKECKPCSVQMVRTLGCGHKHRLPCHLNLDTFQCVTHVETELPCGHTEPRKPCYQSIDTYKCPFPCDTRVEPCGHACLKTCHFKYDPDHVLYKCEKPCEKPRLDCSTGTHKCPKKCSDKCAPCEIVVVKHQSCGHMMKVPCNKDINEYQCNMMLYRYLNCGHRSMVECHDNYGYCKVMVTKINECKHQITIECSATPPTRSLCYEECLILLPCGHKCQNKCNEPCTITCKVLVDHSNRSACGHSFEIECWILQKNLPSVSIELLKLCDSPCRKILSCTHRCSGTCRECTQGRFHKPCKEKCGATLICGHPCPTTCRDASQPCTQKCSYKCRHSACKKTCGDPCTKCNEKCTRKCPHIKCTALCGDVCTVPPCQSPCQKKISCGHDCVGFCGDPCPPLCRECNYEELTETFFGEENKNGARFVLLDECKHVIENNCMNKYLQDQNEDKAKIAPKCCPRCKTILTSTQRYSDYIKKAMLNVFEVKEKYFGNYSENEQKREELLNKVAVLKKEQNLMKVSDSIFYTTLETFENVIFPTKERSRRPLNLMLYTVYLGKLEVMENIVASLKQANLKTFKLTKNVNFLLSALTRNQKRLTKQETTDFEKEMKRFYLLVQLRQIQDLDKFIELKTNTEFQDVFKKTNDVLFSPTIFTDALEDEVANNLDYMTKMYNIRVSKFQFKQSVTAIDMAKSHWLKCPKGHINAIGGCAEEIQCTVVIFLLLVNDCNRIS